jgi:glycosyltransferase involved in cell wall biosynthesis
MNPLVSVGVPVYNGEKSLAVALASILEQDYENVEVIISDNGSTDATSEICARFEKEDARIKYWRSETNNGSIWNFNRVFTLSSGKYFMWLAHDDRKEPSFIRTCVSALEQNPKAVLCASHVATWIEGSDELMYQMTLDSFSSKRQVAERYKECLLHYPALAFYGLLRADSVRKTGLLKKSIASDVVFVQEMSLYGEFIQVAEVLFNYYGRKTWNSIEDDYLNYFGERKPWWYVPFVVLFVKHWQRIGCAPVSFPTKCRLRSLLVAHHVKQVALKMAIRGLRAACKDRWRDSWRKKFYWSWMHDPNIRVASETLFEQRVINARLP